MVDSSLDRILKSPQLPSVPTVAIKLIGLARNLDSSTSDIVEILKTDPALAAQILRSANSSYFGFRSDIRTLEHVVPLIGRKAITTMALSFSLMAEAMTDGIIGQHYQRFWLRSIVQASAAECLAGYLDNTSMASELFMTGLLIDLGQLAMLKVLSDDYLPVIEEQEAGEVGLLQCELDMLGFDHTEAGYGLMRIWKLPESMCDAALHHHGNPNDVTSEESRRLSNGMMVASSVGGFFCSETPMAALTRLRKLTADSFGFTEETLIEFLEETEARVQKTAELLATDTDELPSAADVMAQAGEQLAALSVG